MRPPECDICGESDGCDLVYFKKRPSDIEWDNRMEKNNFVGHPPYVEWFCKKHYPSAAKLSNLPINEARASLRKEFKN